MWLLLFACVPRLYTIGDSDTDVTPWTQPANEWPAAAPPEDLVASGWLPGQTVPDTRLVDQHGNTVSLWQFYGRVVLVDVSTMWCAPCRDLAAHTEETQLDYADQGFTYQSVLSEDVEGDPPDQEDLNLWADSFGIESSPVVSDATREIAGALTPNNVFPVLLVVGRDLKVAEWITTSPPTDEAVRAAIEAHLE